MTESSSPPSDGFTTINVFLATGSVEATERLIQRFGEVLREEGLHADQQNLPNGLMTRQTLSLAELESAIQAAEMVYTPKESQELLTQADPTHLSPH